MNVYVKARNGRNVPFTERLGFIAGYDASNLIRRFAFYACWAFVLENCFIAMQYQTYILSAKGYTLLGLWFTFSHYINNLRSQTFLYANKLTIWHFIYVRLILGYYIKSNKAIKRKNTNGVTVLMFKSGVVYYMHSTEVVMTAHKKLYNT